MTEGELILAPTNLGAIVESWLKFFYSVHYKEYLKNPNVNKKKKTIIEPEYMIESYPAGYIINPYM